ncbi:MAG: SH3 domain-containing protein, partial [Cyanobacteria bacterium P01_G01_bin.49]
ALAGIATFAINQFRNSENVVVDIPSPSPSWDDQSPNQFEEFTPPTSSFSENNSITNATISGKPGTKNVRSGAGTVHSIIGELTTGTRVQIMSSSYDREGYLWYQIHHPSSGLRGWVAGQLITRD